MLERESPVRIRMPTLAVLRGGFLLPEMRSNENQGYKCHWRITEHKCDLHSEKKAKKTIKKMVGEKGVEAWSRLRARDATTSCLQHNETV